MLLSLISKDIVLILNFTFVNDCVNCKLNFFFYFRRISIELRRGHFQSHSVIVHDNSVIVNERRS